MNDLIDTAPMKNHKKLLLDAKMCWHKFFIILPFTCFLFVLTSESAAAKTLVYTDTIPMQTTDWTDVLHFPQFDPANGVLQRIEFSLRAELAGEGYYENVSNTQNVITLTHGANLIMKNDQIGVIADITPTASASVVAPPFDGSGGFDTLPPAFDAPSGGKLVMWGELTSTISYNDPTILRLFTGTGSVLIDIKAQARAGSWDSLGNVDFLLEANAAGLGVVLTYIFEKPEVQFIKLTNGADANDPFGKDVPHIVPGATITWTYLVTNTGLITIPGTDITVTDSHLGITPTLDVTSDVNGDQQLSPGEQWTFVASGIAEDLNAPSPTTTIVNGCSPSGDEVKDARNTYYNLGTVIIPGQTLSDPSHYCNPPTPAINLQKTVYAGHNQGQSCPGLDFLATIPKQDVTYCFVVTNTGNTYLDSIVITDVTLGLTIDALTWLTGTTPLAPGEAITYYLESIVSNNLQNIAQTEGNPTDSHGNDIPNLPNPYDDDPAEIITPTNNDSTDEPSVGVSIFLPLISR